MTSNSLQLFTPLPERFTTLDNCLHPLHSPAVVPFLASYYLIPQLLRERIIEQAIAAIECSSEEIEHACEALYEQLGLTTEAERVKWRSYYHLQSYQLERLATHDRKLEKFKQQTWGHTLTSYFLERKHCFDQVIYSFVRVEDQMMAHELYFRIAEGEQSFADLYREYLENPEVEIGAVVGPYEFGTLHPELAQRLYTAPAGEVLPPFVLNNWYVTARIEKKIPASLDETMRQRLLEEKFEAWFQERIKQLAEPDQIWMGLRPQGV